MTVDGSGNVYVADTVNETIRLITSLGQVSTIAGSVTNAGSVDGAGSNARFNFPQGIAVDSAGNLYVTDSQTTKIREITGGVVSTIAVLGGQPWGITIDGANNLYVTENYRNTIVKIAPVAGTTNWVVSAVAGLANVSGSQDGTNSTARFNIPDSIAVDSATNLYVADQNNHTIRKISPVGTNWVVTTIAGLATNSGSADGLGSSARFFQPSGITVDSATNLYVTSNASLIRKISPFGIRLGRKHDRREREHWHRRRNRQCSAILFSRGHHRGRSRKCLCGGSWQQHDPQGSVLGIRSGEYTCLYTSLR